VFADARRSDWRLILFIIPITLLIAVASLAIDRIDLGTSHLLLLFFLTLLASAPFLVAFVNQRFDMFHPVFALAWTFLVNFVVATFLLLWRNYRLMSGIDYRAQLGTSLLAALVGLAAGYLGYLGGKRLLAAKDLSDSFGPRGEVDRPRRTLFRIAVLVLGLTVVFFLIWLYLARIPLEYLNALDTDSGYTMAMQEAETSVVYLWMFRLSWPLLTLLAWTSAPNVPAKLVAGAAWVGTLFVYIIAANRGSLFFFLAATIIFHYLRQHRRPSILLVVSAFAVLTFASGYLVIARSAPATVDRAAVLDEAAQELTVRGTLTGVMEATYVFPDKLPHLGFTAISDILYAPIPRILWPGKPYLRPVQNIMSASLPTQRSHAPGVVGVYYAGFGLPGVFVILFLYGLMSRAIYNLWRHNPDSPLAQLLLAGWYSHIWNLIIRGALSQTVISIVYIFGPLILAWIATRLATRSLRKQARAAQP
jgi:hypothetical protein